MSSFSGQNLARVSARHPFSISRRSRVQTFHGEELGRVQVVAGPRRVRDLRKQIDETLGKVLQGHGRREQRLVRRQPGTVRSDF